MKDVLVFSHMMKTAGTALIKQLIQHYGSKVLYPESGQLIIDKSYNNEQLKIDFNKKNGNVQVLVGHPIRPHLDLDIPRYNLRWFTFVRDPQKRYLSHYFYVYNYKNGLSNHHRFKGKIENDSIVEWEKIDKCSNYQCKFLSGEANAQKAIDILEKKFEWVGLTEEYDDAIQSFKSHFKLDNLYVSNKITNPSSASQDYKQKVKEKYADFIESMNKEDQILYNYVKDNIWPRFKNETLENTSRNQKSVLIRNINMADFQVDKYLKFNKTKITKKNIIRFYKRWYQ